jgi:hypothetical protein
LHTYHCSQKKKKITKERAHFPAILGFLYRNRFAVASQIQRRFSDILRSDRTARRHLEELESLGYLAVAPARGVSPLFPKVFYVTGRGVKKLQESLAAQGKPWKAVRVDRSSRHTQDGYSADHILHEILITEFLLAVWQTVQARPDLELLTIQRRSLAKHSAFRLTTGKYRSRLIPDAMFLFRQTGGGMGCCFLEMDNGTMNRKQIARKYQRYAAWSNSPVGQQYLIDLYRQHGAVNPRPVFRLLIVASDRTGQNDHHRLRELWEPVKKLLPMMQKRLWFTTVNDLCRWQYHYHFRPLDAAIWHRRNIHSDKETSLNAPTNKWHDFSGTPLFTLFPLIKWRV